MPPLEITPVPPTETRVALRLCLAAREQKPVDLERHVTSFLAYARAMSIDLSRQWFCTSRGRRLAACTCIESPGRTAMLLLPAGGAAPIDDTARRGLIDRVLEAESGRDLALIQAMIELEDDANRRVLESAGFREIAVLRYLELKLRRSAAGGPPRPPEAGRHAWEWIEYGAASHAAFSDLIRATYEGGLDCPGLSDLREMEDVIEGHKAAGRFDPRRWKLLRCDDAAAACLLLVENPVRPSMELAYMGVHPRFRGRGLGRFILDHGIYLTGRDRLRYLTLAVDADNAPARRLYERAGLHWTHSRRAMIRPMRSGAAGAGGRADSAGLSTGCAPAETDCGQEVE